MPEVIGEPISVGDINRVYRSRLGIDVRAYFTAERIELQRRDPIGYYQFSDSLPGDAGFYERLMSRIGYEISDKPEFAEGARWIPPEAKVLDVGCGPGRFSAHCAGDYKGIDLNPGAVAEAKANGRAVFQQDLAAQPADHFDVVTMFQVLEHVSDPLAFAAMAARTVKPGGTLIVSVPNLDGVISAAVNQYLNYPPHHLTWWDETSLRNLMAALDFETVRLWCEPIRPEHLKTLFYALMYPRGSRHFDLSLASKAARLASALVSLLFPRREHPFGMGLAIMIAGRKKG